CNFYNNTADDSGGGMGNADSPLIISNCNFYNNTASEGGGMNNTDSPLIISNCNFYNNTAGKGGGMNNLFSSLEVSNCNFYNNTANYDGGGIYTYSSSPSITNCIFWDNKENSSTTATGADIENNGSSPTISHSLLQNSWSGTGNIDGMDPLFVDGSDPDGADDILGTSDDGLRLRPCSPARDAGEDNSNDPNVPVLDILGNGRFGLTDMGCYEYQMVSSPTPIYVDIDATGSGDGGSWADAYTDLQDAIDYACTGEEIWVAEGTYHPSRVPTGATMSSGSLTNQDYAFHLNKDVRIYGGFDATETLLSDRNHKMNPTILSGASDNCHHVLITVDLTSTAVLDGFRITGGNANGGASSLNYVGGNFDRKYGGGMYNFSSSPSVSNCDFHNNTADSSGGGMYSLSSSPIMSNCNIYDNTAASGGGISNRSSLMNISNCNFYNNASTDKGGGMYNNLSATIVSNCNFYNNTANNNGGGMYNYNSSSPDIINCIFWKNSSITAADSDIEGDGSGGPTVSYSLLQIYAGSMTNSIVGQNPLFVDESDPDGADDIPGTADDGLRLRPCSPVRDAGQDNASNSDVPILDILGNGRSGTTDMGCYENQATGPIRMYVDINVAMGGMGDGSTWNDAYTDLQDAIDYACDGDEIWVAEGTYYPSRIPMGAFSSTGSLGTRDYAFHLNKDVKIYGGFNATETLLSERNHQTNPTILSGDIGTPNDSNDNCYHIIITMTATSAALLDGFHIMGGTANGGTSTLDYAGVGFERGYGGGMYNILSFPSISNCNFYENMADKGGGMYNYLASSSSISNCNFYNNTADVGGGGMYNYNSSSPHVSNCNFYSNTTNGDGGGIHNSSASPIMANCNFYENTANSDGGGIYSVVNSNPEVFNCIFWKNKENNNTA
ncbi:MAG: right-handed parallel beta-helix repeat-containing protein, partial [Saprospiraceae bacterium]